MDIKILYDYETDIRLFKTDFFKNYEHKLNSYIQNGYKILDSNMLKISSGTYPTTGIYTLLQKE